MLEFTPGGADTRTTLFVEVILPLAISGTYTYRIPNGWNHQVAIGKRVIVQFGKNKVYSAIIHRITTQAPERYEAKYIIDILDDMPIVGDPQLQLWEWISSYYLCTLGEVMQAALPAALKLASETKIVAADKASADRSDLNDKEYLILDALDISPELKVSDVVKLLGQKTVFPLLKRLFEKGLILISEELSAKYKPKMKTFVRLHPDYTDEVGRKLLLESLNNAPKQQDAVLAYLQLSRQQEEITRQAVMEASGCSPAIITALMEKEIFVSEVRAVSRLAGEDVEITGEFVLNAAQETAFMAIKDRMDEKDVVLLHGVTASGKTQLYIRLMEEVVAKGGHVLYLLPEIALTAQITERLRVHFGNKLGVYHSRFNDNERAEVWHKVLKGEYRVVVGARSAVFLPFQSLGLVIVDEEHETSYKQFDPAPRYHARDSAIYLAHLHSAKVLLGSATPSVESYYNARSGKYGLVTISQRYGDAQLPEIITVNITEESRKDNMFSYFSGTLLREIEQALASQQQVILFQNRRGHTPLLQCKTCGYIAKCIHCDVSLTYHKSSGKLHCHYCGFSEDPVQVCPACGSTHIESKGFGTERVEEELEILLPDARIGRLDLDSTRGKHGFDRVLTAFDEHRYDILVGTQMVAKGLDFGKVSVIGIINADGLINYPDFRAYERAFSLLAQVSGRAGRRNRKGKVIIQSYAPHHRIIQQVMEHDYEGMFMTEVGERKSYHYPPFYRLFRFEVKHKEQQPAHDAAHRLAALLREGLAHRVFGPEVPLVGRVRNHYIYGILVKVERAGISVAKVKELMKATLLRFETNKANKGVRVQVDVDPY
ncbi:replication restart DNA helicase PriA [Parapedobacter composti]|uniref:Replication restart protein PriA n=1 Tax=Parapedobacter composti TaxID=623281 RepID=A0A1I1JTJ7_9SPHI|nr:primosomal protein N' [Parapedobacter composti]SFC51836.1 replication restart DNA helicase PriA [Parapedobacter composti]